MDSSRLVDAVLETLPARADEPAVRDINRNSPNDLPRGAPRAIAILHLLLGSGRPVLGLHERRGLCGRIRYVPGPLSGQPLLAPPGPCERSDLSPQSAPKLF